MVRRKRRRRMIDLILFVLVNPDASTSIATQILLAFHMLFVNILLINLLIAMFRYDDRKTKDNETKFF